MQRRWAFGLICLAACHKEADAPSLPTEGFVFIHALMANNQVALQDPTGAWPDWVELYNPGPQAIALDEWSVSDDLDNADAFPLTGLQIEAEGHLYLWADNKPDLGPDHLPFSLDADGESFGLYAPDGSRRDGLSFGALPHDISLVRNTEGNWDVQRQETQTEAPELSAALPWQTPGPLCGLESDLSRVNFLEGELIEFTVSCHGELAFADAQIQPVNLPATATWEASTGHVRWLTGPADGARVDLVFSVLARNDTSRVPQAEVITFWVADNPNLQNKVPVEASHYWEEWGLPVIHLSTDGTPTTTTEVPATVVWQGRSYPATSEVHGRSSSNYPKLGYELDFDEEQLPVDLWKTRVDHLVLISTFDDNSYVRQKFVYDLWAAMSETTDEDRLVPEPFFAVLYLNGDYHGLYMAIERVDNNFVERQGFDEASDLYKATDVNANYELTDVNGDPKVTLHDGFEKVEGVDITDFSDLDALVQFTGQSDAETLIAQANNWLYWDEFIDWLLLARYADTEDSTCKNHYLLHAVGDDRMHFIPWDFNASWGQNWRTYRVSSSFNDDFSEDNRLFWAIQNNPEATAAFWARYQALSTDGPLSLAWQEATLDSYFALIDPSAQRDWDKWGSAYQSYTGPDTWVPEREENGDWTDYEGEKDYLYQWVAERNAFFATLVP